MQTSYSPVLGMTATRAWGLLVAIVLIAGTVRICFLTGFQGTDDVVFAKVAHNVANGNLTPGSYIGTLRYGFNFPLAICTMIFGFNEYALTLYPMIASLITIIAVYLIGEDFFGREVGLAAAVLMAFCPLDIIWAGRIQADAPLLMFMTTSCLLFFKAMKYRGGHTNTLALFFASGVVLGLGYTTKNVAIFLWPFLGVLAWYRKIGLSRIAWAVGGSLVVFGAEAAFFFWQTGDPFYPFSIQALHNKKVAAIVATGASKDLISSPAAYPYWAFVTLQHSGLTFYLAAFASVVYFLRRTTMRPDVRKNVVILFAWFLSILLILTFYVMSWKPFVLIWKQPNYMLMFIPPLVLTTALSLISLSPKLRMGMLCVYVVTSLIFASIEREVLAAESSNARATAMWYLQEGANFPLYCGVRDCGVVALFTAYKHEDKLIPYNDPFGNRSDITELASIHQGLVAINEYWMERSGESVSEQNRHVMASPPAEWKLIRVLHHESRGVLYWAGKAFVEVGGHGLVPPRVMDFVQNKIKEAVEPAPVRIYHVGGEEIR